MESLLAHLFLDEFERYFPDWRDTCEYEENVKIVIPAINDEVGDLHIRFGEDEITVFPGMYYHKHFDIYSNYPTLEERKADAARQANSFISDFLADKVVIFTSPQCSGCYYVGTDPSGFLPPLARKFLWSGKIKD
jgi:hypothetical protein